MFRNINPVNSFKRTGSTPNLSRRKILLSIGFRSERTVPKNEHKELQGDDIEYHRNIVAELNNVGTELHQEGKHNACMGLYKDAVNVMIAASSAGKNLTYPTSLNEKRAIAFHIVRGKETLQACQNDSPQSKSKEFTEELDIYNWSELIGVQSPKFLKEPLKILLGNSLAHNNESFMNDYNGGLSSAVLMHNMALLHLTQKRYSVARQFFEISLRIFRSQDGNSSQKTIGLSALNNMGCIKYNQGQIDEALNHFQEGLSMGKEVLNYYLHIEGSPQEDIKRTQTYLATIFSNLGRSYYAFGSDQLAISFCLNALDLRKIALGDNHFQVAATNYNIGIVHHKNGRLENARKYYQVFLDQIQQINRKKMSNDDIVTVLLNIFPVVYSRKNISPDEITIKSALRELESVRKQPDKENHRLPDILKRVVNFFYQNRQYEYALPFSLEQLRMEKTLKGENHPDLAMTLNSIGKIYEKRHMLNEALNYYFKGLELLERVDEGKAKKGLNFAILMFNVGVIKYFLGSYSTAKEACEVSIDIRKKIFGSDHPSIATLLHDLGVLQFEVGQFDEALSTFMKCLLTTRLVYDNSSNLLVKTFYFIGRTQNERGSCIDALNAFDKSLQMARMSKKKDTIVLNILCHVSLIHLNSQDDQEKANKSIEDLISISRIMLGNSDLSVSSLLEMIGDIYMENIREYRLMSSIERDYQYFIKFSASISFLIQHPPAAAAA